jgi:cation diffusion facilitator family transporter
VAYYVVVSVFMRMARKPPDPEHPYGHQQLESIAALVVGSFVVTTAVAIFWNSVNSIYGLLSGAVVSGGAAQIALWVALFTILIKIALTVFTQRVGRSTGNVAVLALGYDHRNDMFSAIAAAVGIFLGQRGYPWVDPLAGALVALVVLRTGIEILRQSSSELMDTVPGRSLNQRISQLLDEVSGIAQVDEVQAHRFGPYMVVNVTICVDGDLTVTEGHSIASEVERTLCRNIEFLRRVHVHYHPEPQPGVPHAHRDSDGHCQVD